VLTLAAAAAAAAAAASVLGMRWKTKACQMSDRDDCCGGCDDCDVAGVSGRVHASVRTGGWSRGTAACPGSAGSVWCRNSWASSRASPWAAEVWRRPAENKAELMLVVHFVFEKKVKIH